MLKKLFLLISLFLVAAQSAEAVDLTRWMVNPSTGKRDRYGLNDNDCSNGEIPKKTSGTWQCGSDTSGSGAPADAQYYVAAANGTLSAEIVPAANVQSILGAADYAAIKALLDLEIGTDIQAYDADLTIYAGITPSANVQSILSAANYAAIRALLDLEAGTDFYSITAADAAFQAKDADLTSWAGVTRASGFDTWTATPSSANLISLLSDENGTGKALFETAVQNNTLNYAADAQASDAYVITLSPAPAAYAAGQCFDFKANTVNTGAATLNVNSLGAKTIKKQNDQDLSNGDIEAGQVVTVCYDGTNFQMQSQVATSGAGSGDITDVYDCASGDCSSIAASDGDLLNFAAVNNSGTSEGIKLPQASDPSAGTAEGQIGWDTDDDIPVIGDGSSALRIGRGYLNTSGSGSSADRYFGVGLHTQENATETNVQRFQAPFPMRLANLYVKIGTAPGAGTSWIITVRTDESVTDTMADTTITCTIADANLKCNDTTHSATISTGKTVTIFADRTGATASPNTMSFQLEYIAQ